MGELALQYSKILNTRLEKSFQHAANDPRVSGFAADADFADRFDITEKRLLGPLEENYKPETFSVARLGERIRSQRRMKMYLERADSVEPLTLPLGRVGREVELVDDIPPIIKQLETELRQNEAPPGV